MAGVSFQVSVEATIGALERMAERAEAGRLAAAQAAGHAAEAEIKRQLTRYSHPKGTPTPSPPGEPPAVVTGSLRRSVIVQTVHGIEPYVDVGPTMVYGRAQELGWPDGGLPARPYVEPARRIVMAGPAQTAALEAFVRVFAR
jgi:hypothetical protein